MTALRLSWRSLWLHPWLTLLAITTVGLGIAALVFLAALDAGWMAQIQRNFALTLLGHVQVHARGYTDDPGLHRRLPQATRILQRIAHAPGVAAAALRIRVDGLAQTARQSAGAEIYGVEPAHEARITRLAKRTQTGRWLRPEDDRAAVVGAQLAETLDLKLGDKLVLMATDPSGEIRAELVRVRGIVRTGAPEVDRVAVFIPIRRAQRWLGLGPEEATGIVLRAEGTTASALAASLRRTLGEAFEVRAWDEIDPMARQWAEFADAYSWVMILIVVGLVVAQSTNALWMNLHGQLHELALMRALGAGRSRVFQVVLWQGVWMVALGTALGFGAGIIASLLAARTGIDLSSFAEALQYLYLEPVVRPILRAEDMEKILAAALAGAVLGALWPARVASRVDPKSATQRGV